MEIRFNNYKLVRKKNILINETSLSIEFNKLQIIGKNGSGKTSLLNDLVNKRDKGVSLTTNNFSYVNQNFMLLKNMSIADNITILLDDKNGEYIYEHFNNFFGTIDKTTLVKSLSGGQKQVLNILFSLVLDNEVVILDEPFNNLDQDKRYLLESFLKNINKKIIIVAHGYDLDFIDSQLIIENQELVHETKA